MRPSLLGITIALIILSSCGADHKVERKLPEVDVITQQVNSTSPLFLEKQSASCEETSFQNSQLDILLNLFLNGFRTNERRNFVSLFRGLRVRSANQKVVARTLYGVHEETIPRGNFSYLEVIKHSEGKDVTVCPDEEVYRRNTVESAALNATYFINKTNQAVRAADRSVRLAPIKLSISPKIQTSFRTDPNSKKRTSIYRTDNAYYMPSEKSITFLPHSQEWRDAGIVASFWEVPMVGSHEYGHHIFQTLAGGDEVDQDKSMHAGPTSCFGHQVLDAAESSLTSRTDKAMIISAFNEGFADLISYYSLDDSERVVSGVKCLEVTRDVGSAKFYDGTEKVFSNYALSNFMTPPLSYAKAALSCEFTSFASIHHIGAIFAYNANKIAGSFVTTKQDKLAITLSWAKALKRAKKTMASHTKELFFREIFALFVKKASQYSGKAITADVCKQVEDSFPSGTHVIPECQVEEEALIKKEEGPVDPEPSEI